MKLNRVFKNFLRAYLWHLHLTWEFFATINSIHGSKHLKSSQAIVNVPRVFWSVMLLSASGLTIYLEMSFLERFLERPLVTSLERDYYTWNTTFPSFTLCSQRKMNETALKAYLTKLRSPKRDMAKLETFLRVLVNLTMYNLETLDEFADFESLPYMHVIERLTNKHDYDVLIDSVPKLKLQRIVSELGICDQFNSELSHIFAADFVINNGDINDRLPAKKPILEVNYFDANPHIVLNDLDDSDIHLHGPFELPQYMQKREISGAASQYKSFSLTAATTVAQQNVRSLFISHRKCRYFDESNLIRFPLIYTYDLCKLECKINAIIKRCNCVPFFYKKLPDEIYCNIEKLICVESHKKLINEETKSCECYPTCTNVNFGIQGESSLNWLQKNKLRVELNVPKMRFKREALHSITDVVAAFGATVALFLGTSLITLIEMAYFGCIRRIIKRYEFLNSE